MKLADLKDTRCNTYHKKIGEDEFTKRPCEFANIISLLSKFLHAITSLFGVLHICIRQAL